MDHDLACAADPDRNLGRQVNRIRHGLKAMSTLRIILAAVGGFLFGVYLISVEAPWWIAIPSIPVFAILQSAFLAFLIPSDEVL